MTKLSRIKRLELREVWAKEATDFTPWLADNITELGQALGFDLELESREAAVGDFSLDLLVKEVGSGRRVIIENQLTQTDHDHLGKLLTYAAGFDSSIIIWIAQSIREEHRQALDWLNQRTDNDTSFFGVTVELLQIDDSNPAFNFNPIVFPNEWQKSKHSQAKETCSPKREAYRQFFQPLIDELREAYRFTGARIAQPQGWYAFSAGLSGATFNVSFTGNSQTRVELYIDMGNMEANKTLFDLLESQKDKIESECGFTLQWERLDSKQCSRIAIVRAGTIESSDSELSELRRWHIDKLLIFKRVFAQRIRMAAKELD